MRQVKRWIPVAALFVLVVLAAKECGEWLDESAMAAVEPDPRTMRPCPGRKPVRENGRKYVWYCGTGVGTEGNVGAHLGVAKVDTVATTGRTTVGAACGRAGAKGHR